MMDLGGSEFLARSLLFTAEPKGCLWPAGDQSGQMCGAPKRAPTQPSLLSLSLEPFFASISVAPSSPQAHPSLCGQLHARARAS